jgi:hypothetical protein
MIIGLIQGNRVELGATDNGYIYKNSFAFDKQTDEICYIPELGIEGDIITEDTSAYRYSDFLEMATDYVKRNGLSNTPQGIAKQLFECVDWQDPNTLLDEWEMCLEDE